MWWGELLITSDCLVVLASPSPQHIYAIITYHHGNTLASLIHSRRPSQEGLRECWRPSDLSGCYVILPPRWSKIQEKTNILEVNQNFPQWIIENIIVNRYVIIFPSKHTQKQWTLALLIHSLASSQDGLRECRRPSDLSGWGYFASHPDVGKPDILEVKSE